jgi:hypothetical protein
MIFSQHPESDLLLELQWCSNDVKKTIHDILAHSSKVRINHKIFRKFLLSELNTYEYKGFGAKAHHGAGAEPAASPGISAARSRWFPRF